MIKKTVFTNRDNINVVVTQYRFFGLLLYQVSIAEYLAVKFGSAS